MPSIKLVAAHTGNIDYPTKKGRGIPKTSSLSLQISKKRGDKSSHCSESVTKQCVRCELTSLDDDEVSE